MASPKQLDDELKSKAKKQLMSCRDPLERMKLLLLARGTKSVKNLTRYFRIMDDNRDQKLNYEEFEDGLLKIGLNDLSKNEMKEIFKIFDSDDSKSISVKEFLIKLRPKMEECRLKLVDQAFAKFDKTGDGVITTDDLKHYDVSNHPKFKNGDMNENQCREEFLSVFDNKAHLDGKITKEEFVAYYSAVSCTIDNHAYFDLLMRQAWMLDE